MDPNRWQDAAYGGAAQLIIAPFVLIIAAPLVIIGFIYYAPPHLRPHLRIGPELEGCWSPGCRVSILG
ncbi:hypothetical protein [Streptomyces sp. OE57]|uniref:hypothetical protein n=1 Tax=Streptomyces lacaronensis TaxID=3379885 RepID=UPI0039B775EF